MKKDCTIQMVLKILLSPIICPEMEAQTRTVGQRELNGSPKLLEMF